MGRPKLDRPNYRRERNNFGIWVIRWTENRIPRSFSARTRNKAEADIIFDEWQAGRDAPAIPANPTISMILDHYLADRKGHVSAYDTLEWACGALRRLLGNLKPEHVSRKLFWDRRKRENVSNGTIIREGVTLRAALEVAAADGLIPRLIIPKIALPSTPAPRHEWITREEANRLLTGAATPHIRLFILLATGTGGRKEALEGLTWGQVHFGRGTIDLALPGRPATRKRRATVPINPELMAALIEAKKVATTKHVLEWRAKPIKDVKKGFAAAVKRAGLRHVTIHTLRHSVATWMVMDGVPLAEVARFLGDTEATVERVYGKHSPEYLRRAARSTELQATHSHIGDEK